MMVGLVLMMAYIVLEMVVGTVLSLILMKGPMHAGVIAAGHGAVMV